MIYVYLHSKVTVKVLLNPPLFNEVHVPSQKSEQSYVC